MQGVRYCLHAGDPDRDLHGLLGGSLRRLLQLRTDAPRGGGDARAPECGHGMTALAAADSQVRRRIRVTGVVQGVGFRPFVQRLATELGLSGQVGNDTEGVLVEVEGRLPSVRYFEARLVEEAP